LERLQAVIFVMVSSRIILTTFCSWLKLLSILCLAIYGLSKITLYNNYEFTNGKCFENFNRHCRHVVLIAVMSYVSFEICSFLLNVGLVFGLWCLMPLSTIFQLYHDGKFYW